MKARNEWWVFRVLAPATLGAAHEHLRGIVEKRYHAINGDICEAVDCFDTGDDESDQQHARELALAEHERTGMVHKVVLTTELVD